MDFSDSEFNKSEFDLATYKRGLASVEEQLVFYKKNEIEKLKKGKESNQIKIDNFKNASKSLDKLIRVKFLITVEKVSDCDEDDSKVMVLKYDNVQHKPEQANQLKKVSQTVLTKSGIVPVSATRTINTVAPKSSVNVEKTRPNAFQKSHSLSRRPFYQQTTLKNRNLNDKVNTAKVNSVNTAKGNRVTSVVGEQGINAVKSSACWCWLYTTQQMVINSPCLIDKKELAIPRYALTANPTIYVSLIEQTWQTVTVDKVNDGEQQLTVTVDGQTIAITEAFVRRHLQLADADGISSLPNTEIFDQLTLMGYVSNDDKLTFQKGKGFTLQQLTPTKVTQGEEQCQESSEAQLIQEPLYARGLFSTTEEVQGKEQIRTDEKVAQKLNDEEMARPTEEKNRK
ncbi:hypothetical protein Tco_0799700 [Tanacetum coccineum]|uniref:Uncharacterized protein n=1 Tax=Tanacetum coccineum TaxID=301880 RepID=A0ABQ4ZS25_9ASTR